MRKELMDQTIDQDMEQNGQAWEEIEVVICGGGPTGAILSALLGRLGVSNVVLEREADITTDPRGIALDEDGIRLLQSVGIYDRIYTEIASCEPACSCDRGIN